MLSGLIKNIYVHLPSSDHVQIGALTLLQGSVDGGRFYIGTPGLETSPPGIEEGPRLALTHRNRRFRTPRCGRRTGNALQAGWSLIITEEQPKIKQRRWVTGRALFFV